MQQPKKDILQTITARKKQIVAERKLRIDIYSLQEKINLGHVPALRSFQAGLRNSIEQNGIAIIAELKKTSPSKGLLSLDYSPEIIAASYEQHGATCLSVLTEEDYFSGSDHDLEIARASCQLPVLRKDFIIDIYQIYESRVLGADCILLIAAILTDEQLHEFYTLATKLGLDVLIEVANETELASALKLKPNLIGINNRNLRDFSIDLKTTIRIQQKLHGDEIAICESGIKTRGDIELMLTQGVRAFLIGEALVKSSNPGKKLAELLGPVKK